MNKEILILIGISGSGKSTFTTNFIKENSNYLRINRDHIRKTLVGDLKGYYQRKDLNLIERNVTRIEEFLFKNLYIDGYNIIIDNTNLKQNYINQWNKMASIAGYTTKFKLFDTISLSNTKSVVKYRDGIENVDYIDKQFIDYQRIRKWILENYKDRIII